MVPLNHFFQKPSTTRVEIRRELLNFLHRAQNDPTLSAQPFDAWMARMAPNQRTTVRHIVGEMLPVHWPRQVRFPNIIELIHWIRARREELGISNDSPQSGLDTEQDANGSEEAGQNVNGNARSEEYDDDDDLVRRLDNEVEDLLIREDDQPAQDIGGGRDLELVVLVILAVVWAPTELIQALLIIFAFLCRLL